MAAATAVATVLTRHHNSNEPIEPVIGIDLGTKYSCVGVYKDGRVQIIENEHGNRITPSYVAWSEATGERLVGDAAKNQAVLNPRNTVFDVKRLIGRKFSDESVQLDKQLLPFEIVNKDNRPYVNVSVRGEPRLLAPEEVSAMILQYLKQMAEGFLGMNVTKAVVTVPAYFNDAQRQATKDAGTIAGLNVLRIINEPTAAAIAYGLERRSPKELNILVYDLGGGTFDASLLSIDEGVFEVLATSGDTHLGGEDFDQRVMQHLLSLIKKRTGKDVRSDAGAIARLRHEVEKAKRALSSVHQTKVEIEALVDGEDFSATLTRNKFEQLNNDLFQATLKLVAQLLKDAGLQKSDIGEIVLAGGSTRIPRVQQLVRDFFDGKEPKSGIDPDEAVAFGAAVQGGILSGEGEQVFVILDVTPLSLGIETTGGVMTTLIERNSMIPTKRTRVFSTARDGQASVQVLVFQGERAMTKHNVLLGKFELSGLAPAPRGTHQIEVEFEIDPNGILSVSATDKSCGRSERMAISADKARLSEAEMERRVLEAEEFAGEDQRLRAAGARHGLEGGVSGEREQSDGGGGDGENKEAAKEVIEWLDVHQQADKNDLEQRRQLEADGSHGSGGDKGDEFSSHVDL